MRLAPRTCCVAVLAALLVSLAPAAFALDHADSLADLSLQELANLPVTSVSKHAEPLADAAASVYVITSDDIRRSGARTLPEALRLAPNLEVGQATADSWAISARGSNETYSDKLLVLIDGRIVYSPIFSGTFWEVQNVMLEDVDHIEVISGPGGTLWGTNAVNGVINIITKKAADTRGDLASAGGGRRGTDAAVRHGGGSGDEAYRVYAMYKDTYASDTATGAPQHDGVRLAQAGFRSDWSQAFTLQGDAYAAREDQALPGQGQATGFNLLGRWDRQLSGGSDLDVLAYYDHAHRLQPNNYGDTLDITDIELQQTLPAIGKHELTWGASYRYAWDAWDNIPGSVITFYPASTRQAWSSLFGQDQIQLAEAWRLIGGARLERGPYTGYEFLPNLRLAWQPAPTLLGWLAASRAVREPARLDTNWYAPAKPPYFLAPTGAFTSETVNVYELGFRSDWGDWSYSAAVYHNDYMHLRTTTVVSTTPLQVTLGNGMTLRENGFETWVTYKPVEDWRLQLGYSALHQNFALAPNTAPNSIPSEGEDAPEWWSLRSSYDFADGLELDATVRHSGALPSHSDVTPNPYIPAYTTGDLRLGWDWTQRLELSLLAQNLFGPAHTEYNPQGPVTQFGRGLYLKLTWRQ
ncbi:MAG TPA: TonB-dependent receptor [Gammaproteobacteria bacterium]|nr:TonB-dependent receptor [Gammaproteobacteria bacterium]